MANSGSPLSPQIKAEAIAAVIGSDFIYAANLLREVQDEQPDLFPTVVKHLGIGMRTAYYFAQIDRQFRHLGAERGRLLRIGWTKLQIIGGRIDKANCEDLLSLAETHTAYELQVLMRGEQPDPDTRCVVLYFTPEQYDVFETAVVAHGGMKSGKGLSGKEDALVEALSK